MADGETTNPYFRTRLETLCNLVGVQEGDNKGKDLIFMDKNFITRTMKISDQFYKEALRSLSIFDLRKADDWDKENVL